jgi:hypothetical protein
MTKKIANKYFVKRSESAAWEDISTKFTGVNVLKFDGFNELGDTVNVFTQQWVNSSEEDFLVAGDSVVRQNVDLQLTFICGERYGAQDTETVHDSFIDYMCNQGDLYVKSAYSGKSAHVVCLKSYKPTTEHLQRGTDSYIMGTITMHCLSPAIKE